MTVHVTTTNAAAPALERPLHVITQVALDDPAAWLRYPAYEPPISPDEVEQVQKEIDGIIGVTRGNKSIAKLVWNGDVRYWKEIHDKWDSTGQAIGDPRKRPHVLYQSIYESEGGAFVRDAFPPRWLIMTRMEIEQYGATWKAASTFYDPVLNKNIQILPAEPPRERYVWFMTIAQHIMGCCGRAAAEGYDCYGRYAHPRHCLDELRQVRAGVDAAGITTRPFDEPDHETIKMRDAGNNNYEEQAARNYRLAREAAYDEAPGEIRQKLRDRAERDIEKFEKDVQRRAKQ